ncbi:uncharacterized protein (DUF2267 family) [Sinorhizobium fredii]
MKEELTFTRPVDAKEAVQTVFHVLSHHLDSGEIRKIRESLSQDVRALWPDPTQRQ